MTMKTTMSELREHYVNLIDLNIYAPSCDAVDLDFVMQMLDELLEMVDDRDRIIKILEDTTSCLPCCVTDMMDDDDREFYNGFYNESEYGDD